MFFGPNFISLIHHFEKYWRDYFRIKMSVITGVEKTLFIRCAAATLKSQLGSFAPQNEEKFFLSPNTCLACLSKGRGHSLTVFVDDLNKISFCRKESSHSFWNGHFWSARLPIRLLLVSLWGHLSFQIENAYFEQQFQKQQLYLHF